MSIENIKEATNQELFNTMWVGLEGQKWEQSEKKDACMYLGTGGKKCAIGHLIDDIRAKHWDKHAEDGVTLNTLLGNLGVPREKVKFLQDAQEAHDDPLCAVSRRNRFLELAKEYVLTIPGRG